MHKLKPSQYSITIVALHSPLTGVTRQAMRLLEAYNREKEEEIRKRLESVEYTQKAE